MDFSLCVCLLISLLISLGAALYNTDPLIINVRQGLIKGKYFTTRSGRTVFGYLGIPYAQPPVGELRFKSPQWPMRWFGIRDATMDRPPCVQNDLLNYKQRNVTFGSEDCLHLNVFSPEVEKDVYLPVMAYFYGGGFVSGSSSSELYGPEYILDSDVVLVVINYRVGPLGFLSTEDESLPGNYGLKDQQEALGWIQRNIVRFGGNKNAVTIFGNGAGGASAHLHMMSYLSKFLFHGAISQSGSALCQWAVNPPGYSKKAAHRVAKQFGCPTNDSEALAKCLRKVPANNITSVVYTYLEFDVDPTVIFAPSIETHTMDPFLTRDPWTITTSVPWMVGIVSEEGAMRVSSLTRGKEGAARVDSLNNECKQFLPTSLMLEKHAEDPAAIAEKVRSYYFGTDKISKEKLPELINMYSDSWFSYCTAEAVRRHNTQVFQYYFTYKGKKSMSSFYGNDKDDLGVCHGDELIYLFPMSSLFPNRTDTKEDIEFSKNLVELWTNFAHFKRPTPTRNVRNSFTFWKPVSKKAKEFLNISNSGFQMSNNYLPDRLFFWHKLRFRNKPLLRTNIKL